MRRIRIYSEKTQTLPRNRAKPDGIHPCRGNQYANLAFARDQGDDAAITNHDSHVYRFLATFFSTHFNFLTNLEPLSLIQVRPSHLASSFSVLKLVSEYNAVNQENLIQFQAKLDSFFSENYSIFNFPPDFQSKIL